MKKYVARTGTLKEFDTDPTEVKDLKIPKITRNDIRIFMTGVQGLKLAPFYIHHSQGHINYYVSQKDSSVIEVLGK